MPSCKEFEAKAVDQAVEKAAADLNIPKKKLKYNVISHGSSGIFGLVGAKKAKISVTLPEKGGPEKGEPEKGGPEKGGPEKGGPEKGEPEKGGPEKGGPEKGCEKSGSGRGRKRNRRKGTAAAMETSTSESVSSLLRETFGEDADESSEAETNDEEFGSEKSETETERDDSGSADVEDAPSPEPTPESKVDPPPEIDPEVLAEATGRGRDVLERIVDMISGDAEISMVSENGGIRYNVAGGNAGVLIGKRGQTLEAIQYLVEKIVNKQAEGRVRVEVDVEGYLDNRKANLEELARKLADKTRKSGKPSSLGHMSAHDRRIVHLALKDDGDVRTQSVGEGFYRKLVIFPNRKRRGRGK